MPQELRYHRILLKLSGEMFLGLATGTRTATSHPAIDARAVQYIGREIASVAALGVQVGVVVGGGNFFRGIAAEEFGIDRVSIDQMGMLGTVINAIALQSVLEQQGYSTRVLTAVAMAQVAEPYIRRRAIRHLEKGRIVIFAGGTGNPYFTTDTSAALRAVEIHADVVLKATKVEGIYDADPVKVAGATKFDSMTYREVLDRDLRVMDVAALSLCRENEMPLVVYSLAGEGNLLALVKGERIGTLVHE